MDFEQFGDDVWHYRTRLDIDKLLGDEAKLTTISGGRSAIVSCYECWKSGGNIDRARTNHDYTVSSEIDVSDENPWNYRMLHHQGWCYQGIQGKRISEYPVGEFIKPLLMEYFESRQDCAAIAHHIRHNIRGFSRDYLRLLLPSQDGKRLTAICRHLEAPHQPS